MRAAVITAPRTLEFARLELPDPPAGHVRIRIEGCGICGSNLPPWLGRPWFKYPLTPGSPGHEAWGRVEAVGANTALAVGDRVATLSSEAFAESTISPQHSVVRLPSALDDLPFPGEPLACAVNVFRRTGIAPGQRVAIVGIGFLGAVLTRLAVLADADVTAISRRRSALDIAVGFGATRAASIDGFNSGASREQQSYDCVIEAVGEQHSLDLASSLVRVRGRLVIAGYHQDGPRRIDLQDWNWRGLDVINAHERDHAVYVEGLQKAIDLVESGALDVRPLFTHTLPLSELAAGFRLLETRPEGFMKALVAA